MKVNGVEFGGQDSKALTFTLDPNVVVKDAVALTGTGVTGRGTGAEAFYGKCIVVEKDGKGAVTRTGIVDVAYSGTLAVGWQSILVDGNGGVKAGANGRMCAVVAVDSTLGLAAIDLG